MPTFDFECKKCGHRFSEFVSIKHKDLVCCPKCNGNVQQLFTGFLYITKGSSSSSSCGSCSGGSCSCCGH